MPEFVVADEQSGLRLDAILAAFDPSLSRSSWQKVILQGFVKIGDQIVSDASNKVVGGSRVSYKLPRNPVAPTNAVPIIYQDADVVVFNKPTGVLTHAKGQLSQEWTLADVARPLIEDDGSNRPGIIHRLDRDTSGLIVVAKTNAAKKFLQRQFSERRVFKRYLALVEGIIVQDQSSLNWPLLRNPKKPSTFIADASGRPAQTEVAVLRRLRNSTLVSLVPATGRTHQLRVHMQKMGHAILGDRLYGDVGSANRLMLHAQQLKIKLPSGKTKDLTAELPADFNEELSQHE